MLCFTVSFKLECPETLMFEHFHIPITSSSYVTLMLVHVTCSHCQKEIYNPVFVSLPCSHYEHELYNSQVSPCSMVSLPAGAMNLPCLYMFHVLIMSRSYVTPMLVHVPCSYYQQELCDSRVGPCSMFSLSEEAMGLPC